MAGISITGQKIASVVDNKHDGTYKCAYTPIDKGLHKIEVTYDGLPVPGSPFPVTVIPGFDVSRVHAFGPGLQSGLTNQVQVFTIETKGAGQGALGLSIEGPSEAKMNCKDNQDGSCQVEYMPTKPGPYEIAIRFADKDIPGSPFTVPIKDHIDASKVRVYGPGVAQEPPGAGPMGRLGDVYPTIRAKKPARFTVDATQTGQAHLDVTYTDKFGHQKQADILTHGDGIFDVVYYPDSEGTAMECY